MTAPRAILPGKTYLVTRRCTQRQFLMRPSKLTNRVLAYCMGLAAERTGVLIHAVCVMSNHWHGVVSDPFARIPEFFEQFHRLVAKAMNCLLGRWENFWSSDKTSLVELISDRDVMDKIAYTLANPTIEGLVKSPDEWPGLLSSFGVTRSIEIPEVFFDVGGELPDEVELELVRPPVHPELDEAALSREVSELVAHRVRRAREEMQCAGKRFLGPRAALTQSVDAVPKTPARHWNLSPRVAARSRAARVRALEQILAFERAYREARRVWAAGQRDATFPPGTYYLRIHAGVRCGPATALQPTECCSTG